MKIKLSAAQKIFIRKLQNGEIPSRSFNDRTGISLEKMGLAIFILRYGWVATSQGMRLNLRESDE